ncbi:BTAD domain-containing putative transcriptional regulator [Streptomyces sp. NPDC059816]|uniref:BTAD domain-containing putative transcriptional regulator n=1 Tax=Streptomyces sp. NPDC059816 TaxID=3346960 RepID=UPI00364A90D6
MRFGVLGPLRVLTDGGTPIRIPGLKVRALLAALLAHEGRVVSVDRLIDDLWGDAPPAKPAAALQVRVSQLRRALEEAEPGARELVVSQAPGYALVVAADAVDANRFTTLAAAGRPAEALELWRGAAYADFADLPFLGPVVARLEEARLTSTEDLAEQRLAAGEPVDVAALVVDHPLRERLRGVHMTALYRAGRQSEALASYTELRTVLDDESGLDPSPELAGLYQRMLRQDPALTAPPAGRPVTNLPAPVSELIGRDTAVAELTEALAAHRLLTLTGSGGVGKTRLALEVAGRQVPDRPDGVWLIELAALDRGTVSLAEAVLVALDVREGPGHPRDQLVAALAGRAPLLVFDNCEHVVEPTAALVADLLRSVPGLRVLATSREPLGLPGEVLWQVPPLSLPDGAGLDDVARSDAVRLFLARARAGAREFTLDPSNAEPVAQLCRRLDGIPLALELAATRVRALGVEELVARLDDRFRLLAGVHRGAPPRQQTLVAVIDWSWTLLTDEERLVLRRLAVHADGCALTAAEAVCAEPGVDVLDTVARLVDRCLVTVVHGPAGPRYRMLESVVAYCLHRLTDAGETDRVQRAHRAHYTALAAEADTRLRGPEQGRWLARLTAESANLRAALTTAPTGQSLRLVNSLCWFWFLRGRLSEARQWLRTALARAQEEADGAPAGDGEERARARAWYEGFGLLLGEGGDPAVAEEIHDPLARARARLFLSLGPADLPSARALVDAALVTCRALGDDWGTAVALSRQARDAFTVRDAAELERTSEESAALFAGLGDGWGVIQAGEWRAGLAENLGDHARAAELFAADLRTAEELGLWPDVVRRLAWLGWLAMEGGAYDRAMEYAGRALRLARERGYREGEVFARMGHAFAARRAGLLDVAEGELRHLLDGVPDDGEPPLFLPSTLLELAQVHEGRGRPDLALPVLRRSFTAALAVGDPLTTVAAVEVAAGLAPPERAALFLGVAAEARRTHATPATAREQQGVERAGKRAGAALGDEAFDAAYVRGRRLTFEDLASRWPASDPSPAGPPIDPATD